MPYLDIKRPENKMRGGGEEECYAQFIMYSLD